MALAEKQGGLAERRVIKDFQDNEFPGLLAAIQKAACFAIEVDVDWDSLMHQGAASQYWSDNFKTVYFVPIAKALAEITSDDMGKEALQEKFKKIKICNTESRSSKYCGADGQTIIFDHGPDLNCDDVDRRAKALKEFLEQNL